MKNQNHPKSAIDTAQGVKLAQPKAGLLRRPLFWGWVMTLLVLQATTYVFLSSAGDDKKSPQNTSSPQLSQSKEFIEKTFAAKVINTELLEADNPNGLTAWTIANESGANVIYTAGTATKVVAFGGAAINTETKENLTLKILAADKLREQIGALTSNGQTGEANTQEVLGKPMMEGDFKGEIPASIKAIAQLKGVTFGDAKIDKTIFVLYDPRCPYCKQVFKVQQRYIDKGYAFKWIATEALGADPIVRNQIQTVLSAKDPKAELTRLMNGDPNPVQINAEKATMESIAENQSFLTNVFKVNGGQAGVPTAFFINHQTGKAQMMQGISEEVVLKRIFGE